MEKAQFKGYILEEVLLYLIRSCGYSIIPKAPPNDSVLSDGHNWLNVRGRGANHQVDVLGELQWIPAFTYPLRLISEAKFHDNKVGIDVIRNQVGILADINENHFSTGTNIDLRYRYASVVFSASGFSSNAIDMAIAHQIQVVDLDSPDYASIKRLVENFADSVFGQSDSIPASLANIYRTNVRRGLWLWHLYLPEEFEVVSEYQPWLVDHFVRLIKHDLKELFIGMSNGGFMLLMTASDPERFIAYAKQEPSHKIWIHWDFSDGGRIWNIAPVGNRDGYRLSFKLPKKVHDLIYESNMNAQRNAMAFKQQFLSKISMFYHDLQENRDYVFTLNFEIEDSN